MASTRTDETLRKLESVGVATRHVTPAEFGSAIEDAIAEPAVGVALSDLPVSLTETDVTVDPTPAELKRATTGVTRASTCIADYGSLVLPCRDDGSELLSLFVENHVAVLREEDVVADMETAFEAFAADPSEAAGNRILATGPSATADMGALVKGAHGPRDVTAIVLES